MSWLKLDEIASVMVGHVFKGKAASENTDNPIRVAQISDIRGYSISDTSGLARANLEGKSPKLLLEDGDVLFTLKCKRLHACLFDLDSSEKEVYTTLVTTQNTISIIRPDHDYLRTDYLLWYLNSPASLAELESMQVGSTVPSISLKNFKTLKVPLPSFDKQVLIGKAYRNWCQQETVLNNLIVDGKRFMHSTCLSASDIENTANV